MVRQLLIISSSFLISENTSQWLRGKWNGNMLLIKEPRPRQNNKQITLWCSLDD